MTRNVLLGATSSDVSNAFPEMLYKALEHMGVDVIRGRLKHLAVMKFPKDKKPVVHLHWITSLFQPNIFTTLKRVALHLVWLAFLKVRGVGIVWTPHNDLSHHRRWPGIERFMQRILFRLADRVIAMSDYEVALISRRVSTRIAARVRKIPLPTYESVYGKPMPRGQAKSLLGYQPEQCLFLFIGRVTRYKGISELLHAFEKLETPHARLAIVGAPESDELANAIYQATGDDPRIRAELRHIPDSEMSPWLSACDWVVLPYTSILNSSSVMLALTFGRPTIAPRYPTLVEILDGDVEAGLLYGDSLATALSKAISMVPEQKRLFDESAASVALRCDLLTIAKQTKLLYEEVGRGGFD